MKLDDLLENTSHNIVLTKSRIRCVNCLSNFSLTDSACRHWLTTSCLPENSAAPPPHLLHIPIPINQPIHLGNQLSHSTHKMNSFRGLIYCSKCGARAGPNQIRYLARQCEPPSIAGQRTLNAIENGVLPQGYTEWPG